MGTMICCWMSRSSPDLVSMIPPCWFSQPLLKQTPHFTVHNMHRDLETLATDNTEQIHDVQTAILCTISTIHKPRMHAWRATSPLRLDRPEVPGAPPRKYVQRRNVHSKCQWWSHPGAYACARNVRTHRCPCFLHVRSNLERESLHFATITLDGASLLHTLSRLSSLEWTTR